MSFKNFEKIFLGMQGFDMHIDENGNAQGNYTLLSLQSVLSITDKESKDYYPLNTALDVSADFIANGEQDGLPALRFRKVINWVNNHIPLDEPVCGFHGKNCQNQRGDNLFPEYFFK